MEKHYTYILYSKLLDNFYVGATRLNPTLRKERHLEEYYGKSKFTAKAERAYGFSRVFIKISSCKRGMGL